MPSLLDGLPEIEPSALTGFAGNRIDRRSEHRTADSVALALGDPAVRVYLFRGDKVLVKSGGDPLFTVGEADALQADRADALLLGWAIDGPRVAANIPETMAVDEARIGLTDLRALAVSGGVSAEHLGALAQARSLSNWHWHHRFCSNCGAASTITAGGYRRDCPACGAQHFPRTDPVVIMLALDTSTGVERALLGRQPRFPPGMYSCLAGFLEPGETIENAVRRETLEESGIRVGRVRYHASQPWPFPASLMIGCHAEALTTDIHRDEVELEDCRWFSKADVRAMMAGTHAEGIMAPTPMAIAHHLVAAWVKG